MAVLVEQPAEQPRDIFSRRYRIINKGKGLLVITPENLEKIGASKTSELENDGADGLNPFITEQDIPAIPAEKTKTSEFENDGANGVDPFITAKDVKQNNFSDTIEVYGWDLDGIGTIEEQIAKYVTSLNRTKTEVEADIWVKFYDDMKPNLIIKGVGGITISSKSDLVNTIKDPDTFYDYSEENILYFEVVGTEVRAFVTSKFALVSVNLRESAVTSFLDKGNNCVYVSYGVFLGSMLEEFKLDAATYIGDYVFNDSKISGVVSLPSVELIGNSVFTKTAITELNAPNLLQLGEAMSTARLFMYCDYIERIYIPKCIQLGYGLNNDNVFQHIGVTGFEIVCPLELKTINNGSREGDIAMAEDTYGAIITYV